MKQKIKYILIAFLFLGCKSFENKSEVPKKITYDVFQKQELGLEEDKITGMVYSKKKDSFWIQTQSENEPYLFLVNAATGTQKEKVFVRGISMSWQGLSYHSDKIRIGDIGDPLKNRKAIQVYSIEEKSIEDKFVVPTIQNYKYPEKNKDAKAMLFHPKYKMYYFFTYGDNKTEVYGISSKPKQGVLKRIGDIGLKNVTDVHLSKDLNELLIVSKNEVMIYNVRAQKNVISVLKSDIPQYRKDYKNCIIKSACFYGENNDLCLLIHNPIQNTTYYTIEKKRGNF